MCLQRNMLFGVDGQIFEALFAAIDTRGLLKPIIFIDFSNFVTYFNCVSFVLLGLVDLNIKTNCSNCCSLYPSIYQPT